MLQINTKSKGPGKKHTRIPNELKKKILFTLALVLAYRVGSYLPVPGIPVVNLMENYQGDATGIAAVSALNMFSGGALSRMSFLALGTMPYITAQIIIQMLGTVIPSMADLNKDEAGQRKSTQYTRYLTIAISAVNAIAYVFLFRAWGINFVASDVPAFVSYFMIVATMIVGALVVMWFGELITQYGVGNGMSLLIGINILSGIPSSLISSVRSGTSGQIATAITLLCVALLIPLIVLLERGQRRIPITYSKQVRGNSVIGGGSTYLPIKINMAGVIPIIFASTVLYLPAQMAIFFPGVAWLQHLSYLISNGWLNWVLSAILIVFFSYFYSSIVFDADETADNIKRNGGFVPGFRPGKPTADYIRSVVDNVTLPGAIFMACLSVIPSIAFAYSGANIINTMGGTSVLILVGVVIDTVAAIKTSAQDYNGFFE